MPLAWFYRFGILYFQKKNLAVGNTLLSNTEFQFQRRPVSRVLTLSPHHWGFVQSKSGLSMREKRVFPAPLLAAVTTGQTSSLMHSPWLVRRRLAVWDPAQGEDPLALHPSASPCSASRCLPVHRHSWLSRATVPRGTSNHCATTNSIHYFPSAHMDSKYMFQLLELKCQ